MAFCDWCRLETVSEEACEWCKRPIRRNYNRYAYRDSVSLLREDNEESGDRLTTIFGVMIGVAVLGLMVFAGINFRGGDKGADPLSQVADSEKTWTAERSAPPPAIAGPIVPNAASRLAPATSARPVAQSGRPASHTPTHSPGTTSGYALASSAILRDGEFGATASTTGFSIEQVELSVARESGGTYRIGGTIRVTNRAGGRIEDITIRIVAGDQKVDLDLGGQDTDLGSAASRTFRVGATGVSADVVNARDAMVEITGSGPDGGYRDRIRLQ